MGYIHSLEWKSFQWIRIGKGLEQRVKLSRSSLGGNSTVNLKYTFKACESVLEVKSKKENIIIISSAIPNQCNEEGSNMRDLVFNLKGLRIETEDRKNRLRYRIKWKMKDNVTSDWYNESRYVGLLRFHS